MKKEKNPAEKDIEQPEKACDADQEAAAPTDTPEQQDHEAALLKDQLLRALADLDNLQKRSVKEKEDIQKFAISAFARDILSVYDSLEKALETARNIKKDEAQSPLAQGIEIVFSELNKILQRHKVEVIDPVGAQFDPMFHQAVSQVEVDGQTPGTVVSVLQKGYSLYGRLLRPAMVTVAK